MLRRQVLPQRPVESACLEGEIPIAATVQVTSDAVDHRATLTSLALA